VARKNYTLEELAYWADEEGGIISLLRHGIDWDLLPEDMPEDVRSALENVQVMLDSDVQVIEDWFDTAGDYDPYEGL
jgi:hypothetical protein